MTVFIVLGTILIFFVVIFLFIVHSTMSALLLESEQQYLSEKLEYIQESLYSTQEKTAQITKEVAEWDAVIYAIDENSADKNRLFSTLTSLMHAYEYHMITIKNAAGQDIFHQFYDIYENKPAAMPQNLYEQINQLSAGLLHHNAVNAEKNITGRYGVLIYNNIPFFICVEPVFAAKGNSEPIGTLTFGYAITIKHLQKLVDSDTVTFDIIPANGNPDLLLPGLVVTADNTASGSILFAGMEQDSVVLRINLDRSIYSKSFISLGYTNFILILAAIVLLLLVHFLITKLLLKPMEVLGKDIKKISADHFHPLDISKYSSAEEFSSLGASINDMLIRMGESIAESENSHTTFHILQNIIDWIDPYIYITDIETNEVLFINQNLQKMINNANPKEGQCWSLLFGWTERCQHCPVNRLREHPNETVVWEHYNSKTGRLYRNNDYLIPWIDGRTAHIHYGVDITERNSNSAHTQTPIG